MVGFFPTPYPDECLYSILCRYYAHSGNSAFEACLKELFGNVLNITLSIFLPMRIECLDEWVSPLSGITRNSITLNNTLYSYWYICYSPSFRAKMDRVIDGGISEIDTNKEGALQSRRSWAKYLKYCPFCVADDNAVYGETYWHRQHQLSEILYCTKHQVRLINSDISVCKTGTGFYPAAIAATDKPIPDKRDNLLPFKDKFIKIASESEWLIANGLKIDWSLNSHEKYSKMLRDMGLSSFQGRCYYPELDSAFYDYWGKDFLKTLFSETENTRFKGWTYKVDKNKMCNYLPLYHILLMCFISGSIAEFINAEPAKTPYGNPPFECENPVCPHFHVDGADMVEFSYYGNGVRAVFECADCGMRYKVNKSKCSRELPIITEYGELWEREFLRCCQDKSITNEQTANIFKCDSNVIMLQKKKRGLLRQFHYGGKLSPIDFYKSRIEEVYSKFDELTITLLNEKVPGAYEYLLEHDREWLRDHIVFKNQLKNVRDYENEMLFKLKEVIAKFNDEGYPKRQITYGYIAELVGSSRDKLRYRKVFKTLLETVIESHSDWLRRRAKEICKERISSFKATTTKTIIREMDLHSQGCEKRILILQEVIDTIYGK